MIGYLNLDSKFEEKQKYAVIEIMTEDGQHVVTTSQSGVVMQQLTDNYEAKNFPFRSVLQHKMNQKGTYKYYSFV